MGNGVTTAVYGDSEATGSTFGTSHPVATLLDDSPSQGALQGVADLGDGSGTPVPPLHPSLLPPTGTSPSPGPHLLANPHLAHLEASSSSQPQLSQVPTQGPSCLLPQGPTTASLGPRDRPTLCPPGGHRGHRASFRATGEWRGPLPLTPVWAVLQGATVGCTP